MATQMVNADTNLVTIQSLLGHSNITTTERYSKIHSSKRKRDYFKAMEEITEKRTEELVSGTEPNRFFTRDRRLQVSKNFETVRADGFETGSGSEQEHRIVAESEPVLLSTSRSS